MKIISQTPTITAGAYSAGDAVGGKLTFTGCTDTGLIHNLTLIDLSEQAVELNLVLFNADFTATADNAAFDVTSGEEADIIGVINIATTDYEDIGGLKVATVKGLSLPFELTETDSTKRGRIYGQLVAVGAPTYVSTSDLTAKLAVLPYQ